MPLQKSSGVAILVSLQECGLFSLEPCIGKPTLESHKLKLDLCSTSSNAINLPNLEIPKRVQSSDVACEQAPKEIDHRLRRKTTKGTIHYENETKTGVVITSHQFSDRALPLQKSTGGWGAICCPYICARITARFIPHNSTQAYQLKKTQDAKTKLGLRKTKDEQNSNTTKLTKPEFNRFLFWYSLQIYVNNMKINSPYHWKISLSSIRMAFSLYLDPLSGQWCNIHGLFL